MFQLFVSITLDTLEKCREGLLLLSSEKALLFLDDCFHYICLVFILCFLQIVDLQVEHLSLLVSLAEC